MKIERRKLWDCVHLQTFAPEKHIRKISSETHAKLANIRVAFRYLDTKGFPTWHTIYIRPTLTKIAVNERLEVCDKFGSSGDVITTYYIMRDIGRLDG